MRSVYYLQNGKYKSKLRSNEKLIFHNRSIINSVGMLDLPCQRRDSWTNSFTLSKETLTTPMLENTNYGKTTFSLSLRDCIRYKRNTFLHRKKITIEATETEIFVFVVFFSVLAECFNNRVIWMMVRVSNVRVMKFRILSHTYAME